MRQDRCVFLNDSLVIDLRFQGQRQDSRMDVVCLPVFEQKPLLLRLLDGASLPTAKPLACVVEGSYHALVSVVMPSLGHNMRKYVISVYI